MMVKDWDRDLFVSSSCGEEVNVMSVPVVFLELLCLELFDDGPVSSCFMDVGYRGDIRLMVYWDGHAFNKSREVLISRVRGDVRVMGIRSYQEIDVTDRFVDVFNSNIAFLNKAN